MSNYSMITEKTQVIHLFVELALKSAIKGFYISAVVDTGVCSMDVRDRFMDKNNINVVHL